MTDSDLARFRQMKDDFFRTDAHSPLTREQKRVFDGLSYYTENPALRLEIDIEPFETQDEIEMQTTGGDVQSYRRYGRFTFQADGQDVTLTIYAGEHGYFLPFVDGKMGEETYPAGRYLEPEELGDGRFLIDFNLAYNPYCAYNERWSCPLTPFENRTKAALRAGEKIPGGAWAELGGVH